MGRGWRTTKKSQGVSPLSYFRRRLWRCIPCRNLLVAAGNTKCIIHKVYYPLQSLYPYAVRVPSEYKRPVEIGRQHLTYLTYLTVIVALATMTMTSSSAGNPSVQQFLSSSLSCASRAVSTGVRLIAAQSSLMFSNHVLFLSSTLVWDPSLRPYTVRYAVVFQQTSKAHDQNVLSF